MSRRIWPGELTNPIRYPGPPGVSQLSLRYRNKQVNQCAPDHQHGQQEQILPEWDWLAVKDHWLIAAAPPQPPAFKQEDAHLQRYLYNCDSKQQRRCYG